MSKASIQIIYEGSALEKGLMDVKELAPALLSIGELFQETNRLLNHEKASLSVNVKSEFQRGSFGIDFQVIQTITAHAQAILIGDDVKSAKELITLVFGSNVSLLALIKWYQGRKNAKVTPIEDNKIRLEFENTSITNSHIEVNANIFNLYKDSKVRNALEGTVKPLKIPGIDNLKIKKDNKTLDSVSKDDVPYFSETIEDLNIKDLNTQSSKREEIMELISPTFKEDNKWKFSDGSGGFIFASIKDESFLKNVEDRQITFGKGDIFKVLLSKETSFSSAGKLQTENIIHKVIEIYPPRQPKLFS